MAARPARCRAPAARNRCCRTGRAARAGRLGLLRVPRRLRRQASGRGVARTPSASVSVRASPSGGLGEAARDVDAPLGRFPGQRLLPGVVAVAADADAGLQARQGGDAARSARRARRAVCPRRLGDGWPAGRPLRACAGRSARRRWPAARWLPARTSRARRGSPCRAAGRRRRRRVEGADVGLAAAWRNSRSRRDGRSCPGWA